MKFSRRTIVFLYILLVILVGGILFWPFIVSEIINPVSMVVWLFLRLFVLSIAQKYYWTAIIFAACHIPLPSFDPGSNHKFIRRIW